MPRVFKYGDILNINLTLDKELNILIYRLPSHLIIYRSHTPLKMVRFFGPTCTVTKRYASNSAKMTELMERMCAEAF